MRKESIVTRRNIIIELILFLKENEPLNFLKIQTLQQKLDTIDK